ncbi:MAG: toxin-activating lysine-acyltransferase [Methylophilaceae bacterium]|nr:toxin-activating lysine-acyltransferase [Methylophilaceae bacterium]
MKFGTLDVIAPGVLSAERFRSDQTNATWTEAEVFGSAIWLWMHSQKHRELPLHMLSTLLLPALKNQQYILVSEHGKPVFYLSWANLSADAESRYIKNPSFTMPQDDWNSGDRMWILDWVAPFGHTREMSQLLAQHLFGERCMRALYHRGYDRGLRVKTFYGVGVMSEVARFWFKTHPIV